MKRILIFNVNWLGDVLFSTAAIRNIRKNFPDSFIACIIPGRCHAILEGNTNLDEIIIFDEKTKQKGLIGKLKFIRFLKSRKFDTAFLLHRSFSRALICWLSGIKERVGYNTKKRSLLLTKKIPPVPIDALHRIDYYLNVIEKAGLKIQDKHSDFFISEKELKFADDFLSQASIEKGDFLIGINPGGNWLPKRWPVKYWAELADRLIRELKAKIIITGGSSDIALANEICVLMKEKPLLAAGRFNLKESAALFTRLDLFISADSGPLHIANAVGTKKIIGLFGPTSAKITGPYPTKSVVLLQKDIGCKIPCYVVSCKDNRCMKAITVEDVVEQIKA